MDIDTSYDQDDDFFDSDAIDSEIEEQLYAQIHHQSDGGDVTSFKGTDSCLGHETDFLDSEIEGQKENSASVSGLFSADEVITIGSDSEDDLCSKSMIVGKISKPGDEISDSESSLLDICSCSSEDEQFLDICSHSSEDDGQDLVINSHDPSSYSLLKDLAINSHDPSSYSRLKSDNVTGTNAAFRLKSDNVTGRFRLKLGNVTGSNAGLSRVSLTDGMKDNFIESSCSEKSDQSPGDDDVQVSDDDERSGGRVIKRLSSKNVLKSFLGKCKPTYCPSTEDEMRRKMKSNGGEKEKKMKSNGGEKEKKVGKIKEVTIELLNSIPGSNNRFKRMKLDPGESGDLWRVDVEDMSSRGVRGKTRYYRKHRCTHCRDFTSHTTDRCPFPKPEPVCAVCGSEGHVEDLCDNIICSKCFTSGHDSYTCSFNFKNISCDLCSLFGHEANNCPNHWRQHHLTTTQNNCQSLKIRRNVSRISCGGCGRRGHFAHECHQLYTNKSFWPTSPFLEPSSAMFNINNKKRGLALKSPTPRKGREKRKKSDASISNHETVSTPATVKKRRCSRSLAAIDSLSTLFDPSMSNTNSSNGRKTKKSKKSRTTVRNSKKSQATERKSKKSQTTERSSTASKKRKRSKASRAGSTQSSGKKKKKPRT